jgi:hypothetical protein
MALSLINWFLRLCIPLRFILFLFESKSALCDNILKYHILLSCSLGLKELRAMMASNNKETGSTPLLQEDLSPNLYFACL